MGTAYASTLGEDESFTTLELKINFPAAVPERLSHRNGARREEREDDRAG